MHKLVFSFILIAAMSLGTLVPAALADEVTETTTVEVAVAVPAATDPANLPAYLDEDLIKKHADFSSFAKSKVRSLNSNHHLSKSRMKIERQPDGTYRARYHSIDDGSLVCKVRRSSSTTIPYVGVLSYKEKIFEAVAASPDGCKMAEFIPVAVIPNRHIFSFKQGTWQ
jgi:hypothetical protein